MAAPRIEKIEIEDDLSMQDHGAIEVTITLSDGKYRWCYFMTPAALEACGDWVDGTRIRFHFGSPHMIVVAETLTEDLITKALHCIEQRGEVLDCTMAIDETTTPEQDAPADAKRPRR
ncbi:MAG: hypothetical protein QGH60_21445 [Phycisphaerae bacterium]|jgi:hypothetical protein|nr:hypothetical protein [Phycisphaerae bacterium]